MGLSVLKDIRKIYAGLNAEQIRQDAEREVRAGIMAEDTERYSAVEDFFAPAWLDEAARSRALQLIYRADGSQARHFDFIISEPGSRQPPYGYRLDHRNPYATANAVASNHQPLELALARNFPQFRQAVADRIIRRISRENALFSLMTALPNVVPSIVDLPWAIGEFASDTAFLTINQIRMALLLSAAHGRPIGYGEQKLEIATIAAGAFGWRAIARELVGKIPLGGGLIPKAAVAFAGTWVVGIGLEKVNRTGSGLSRSEKRDAWADAFARGKQVVRELAPSVIKGGAFKDTGRS